MVIDEVQKLPRILDRVHYHIEKHKRQFILTGSSARRLKQQGVNLLAGRALEYHLYPLSYLELKKNFDLQKMLEWGGLPRAYLAQSTEEAREFLMTYAKIYLEKEIQQEQWVRKIEPFRKFLPIAAQMNGEIINRARIARDVGVDSNTVASYYEILEDTLLGFTLPAFHRSVRKVQIQSSKFYFADTGMKRALDKSVGVPLLKQSSDYGKAFEHFIILEFIKFSEYHRKNWNLSYLRTKDDAEIDLIIDRPGGRPLMIEIKSANKVFESDAKTLETLGKDVDLKSERWIISQDPLTQKFGGTTAYHWQKAFDALS